MEILLLHHLLKCLGVLIQVSKEAAFITSQKRKYHLQLVDQYATARSLNVSSFTVIALLAESDAHLSATAATAQTMKIRKKENWL